MKISSKEMHSVAGNIVAYFFCIKNPLGYDAKVDHRKVVAHETGYVAFLSIEDELKSVFHINTLNHARKF